ncbi:MAG: methyltransferase domain-containing protein [Flavobacteriales bacterium]|nr:methyltransferase domain-containing protein [Flavobacteriales bacterium]
MESVLANLKRFENEQPTFVGLGEELLKIDFKNIDYKSLLPEVESQENYVRNIITLSPIEVILIVWPPKTESAVHFHDGFFGYVAVLKGALDNIEYTLENLKLKETGGLKGLPGGLIAEKDGMIHKLVNLSETENAVTAHFYYPALENLNGIDIYDIETGRIGTLNDKAATASWLEPKSSFSKIEENAFSYLPYHKHKSTSHRIYSIVPKPDRNFISGNISAYYSEQAHEYDFFDLEHESRKTYIDKINELIAYHFKKDGIKSILTLACGTGRRALEIKEMSGLNYKTKGVDISVEMAAIANERGLNVIRSSWIDANLNNDKFDAVTFLYAFGHIPSREERQASLQKIAHHLNDNGSLYLDVFNVNDKNEWGPSAVKAYEKGRYANFGYEKGDVFYKKVTGNEIAFLHYFDENQLVEDLKKAGFSISFVEHIGYVKKSGQILTASDEGALFIKATKA